MLGVAFGAVVRAEPVEQKLGLLDECREFFRFVAEVIQLFRAVVGSALNPVCYVVVHEIAADAWGYDGRTQADRVVEANVA